MSLKKSIFRLEHQFPNTNVSHKTALFISAPEFQIATLNFSKVVQFKYLNGIFSFKILSLLLKP